MFIGFLFSQWQKGHLPAAALQSSFKISWETYLEMDQSTPTPPLAPVQEYSELVIPFSSTAHQSMYFRRCSNNTCSHTFLFVLSLYSVIFGMPQKTNYPLHDWIASQGKKHNKTKNNFTNIMGVFFTTLGFLPQQHCIKNHLNNCEHMVSTNIALSV